MDGPSQYAVAFWAEERSDGGPLLLAARELRWQMIGPVGDFHSLHYRLRTLAAFCRRNLVVDESKLYILANRQLVNEIEVLKDESDVVPANVSEWASLAADKSSPRK